MYNPREILRRSPSEISGAIIVLLNLLVLTNALNFGDETRTTNVLAGINVAVVTILTLFYIKPGTVSRAGLQEVQAAQEQTVREVAALAAPVVNQAETVVVNEAEIPQGRSEPIDKPPRSRRITKDS